MDQEFDNLEGVIESIDGSIGNVEINTTAARKHVGKIERDIHTGKDQCRAIVSVLPYSILSKMVVINLVYYEYIFLNCEINPLGISESQSPREIILRPRLDWNRHCCGTTGCHWSLASM